jgi:protein-S-isoprenylcysteine O-methyltransferase Ste14
MSHATKPTRFPVAEHPQRARVPARIILAYAVGVYLVFLAVLGYAAGFFAGLDVPKGIDQGPHAAVLPAAAIDLLLLALFAVQLTVMARPWFKRRWTRIVPGPAERSTFVLATCLVLALLFWLWRPIGGTVWNLRGPGADVLWAVYVAGWVLAIGSTFLISHFDLFGAAAGLAECAARQVQPPALHRARPVPAHPASPDGRVRSHILGGACYDGRTPAVRSDRDRLHPGWHRVRRT